jgi:hypothetical protein
MLLENAKRVVLGNEGKPKLILFSGSASFSFLFLFLFCLPRIVLLYRFIPFCLCDVKKKDIAVILL